MVKSGKEECRELYRADMSNPTRVVPVYGTVTNYKTTRNAVMGMIGENIEVGMKMEEDINELIKEEPPKYTSVDYADVTTVELSGGTLVSLPHIIIRTNGKKMKFRLMHSNYEGRGKLSDEVFGNYEAILRKAFAEKITVKP